MESKTVDDIKVEIRDLIDECARRGVLIESITPEFVGTLDGQARVTFINIVERRLI